MSFEDGTSQTVSGFVDELNAAVRANPVAASLIGMGAVWMFFGGSRIAAFGGAVAGATKNAVGTVGSSAGMAARTVGDGLATTGARAGGLVRDVGDGLATAARTVGDLARDSVSSGYSSMTQAGQNAAHDAEDTADDLLQASKATGKQFATTVQSTLSTALERQPLLLGAIGIAIGAGIASTFASTQRENELLGETGATLKAEARSVASKVKSVAAEALQDITSEADIQGLTPSAIKKQAADVASKLKTVAGAAGDSIKARLP